MPKAERDTRPEALEPAVAQAHAHGGIILGCILAEPERYTALLAELTPADLLLGAHRLIYDAARAVAARGALPTYPAVGAELTDPELRVTASQLLDLASHQTDPRYHLAELRRLAYHRGIRAAAQGILDAPESPNGPVEAMRLALESGPPGSQLLRPLAWSELTQAVYPPREDIIGRGLLTRGCLALLAGKPGGGKSYLVCHLMACAGTGSAWLGLDAPARPMRCGYLGPEVPDWLIAPWLQALSPNGAEPLGSFLIPPRLGAHFDLLDPTCERAICDWASNLDLLTLDPLGMIQRLDLNDAQAAGAVMAVCQRVRLTSGAAVLLLHHPRKSQPGGRGKSRTDPIDDPAGSYRLEADPDVVMFLSQRAKLLQLKVLKNRLGPMPDPIWIKPVPNGIPQLVDAPEIAHDKRQAATLQLVSTAGPEGIAASAIASIVEVDAATVRRYLDDAIQEGEVEVIGRARKTRYRDTQKNVAKDVANDDKLL